MKTCDLTLTRSIPARPEAVFDVWIDPKSPGGPWFGAAQVILNSVVDGLFYHVVAHEGRRWPHYGRFLRLERPTLIEHTWMSESTHGLETIVTITLEPSGSHTALTLRHSGVPDDDTGRQHEAGWGWLLDVLADCLGGAKP